MARKDARPQDRASGMIEFYAQIKWVHVAAVLASGGLFFIRGMLVMGGAQHWALWAPVRYLSYAIDTVLLTAALMLLTILQQYPFVDGWLTVKVGLLVVYIVLGTLALKRGNTPRARAATFAGALAVYVFIASVARAHHPLGMLILL